MIVKLLEGTLTGKDFIEQANLLHDFHEEIPEGEICHCDICQIASPLLFYAAPIIDEVTKLHAEKDRLYKALELVKAEFGDDSHLRLKPLVWAMVDKAIEKASGK